MLAGAKHGPSASSTRCTEDMAEMHERDHRQAINKFTSDDRWFSAIGRFIFEFSQLEYTLKHYIAEAIGLKEQHFNSIMSHDFARLCGVAQTVLLQTSADPTSFLESDWGEEQMAPRFAAALKPLMDEQDAQKVQRTNRLRELLKECKSLNEDRVRVVHGLWMIGEGTGELDHVSRSTLTNGSYFRDPDKLAKKADDARHLRTEIERWIYSGAP
jgi:hypothetical protein